MWFRRHYISSVDNECAQKGHFSYFFKLSNYSFDSFYPNLFWMSTRSRSLVTKQLFPSRHFHPVEGWPNFTFFTFFYSEYNRQVCCLSLASLRHDKPGAGSWIRWQHWHHVLPGQRVWLRPLCARSGWSHRGHIRSARRWVQYETAPTLDQDIYKELCFPHPIFIPTSVFNESIRLWKRTQRRCEV